MSGPAVLRLGPHGEPSTSARAIMTSDHDHDHDHVHVPDPDGWLLPEDVRAQIGKLFATLAAPVDLEVFTDPAVNAGFNEHAAGFVRDLARISDKIKPVFHDVDSERGRELKITGSPVIAVAPDKYRILYRGAPLGEEGRSFLAAILHASAGKSGLSKTSRELLERLDEPRRVRVFVTLACPYCPDQVLHAVRSAIERPELVAVEVVEMDENRDLADELGVGTVPHTMFYRQDSDRPDHEALGLMPEERFVLEMAALRDAEDLLQAVGPTADQEPSAEPDLVIVGGGPAGLTAGIYAERSGMVSVVLERDVVGGQVAVTPVVENYPGFTGVPGKRLMEIMAAQARQYAPVREGEGVLSIERDGERFLVRTNRASYSARAVLLATGAVYRKLGAPGEQRYFGRGVNYCATCDGYLYKGKRAHVVGGGNTALTDALHLKHLGVEVSIIHRRDAFRAEKHLQDSVAAEGIEVLWNTEVEEILGKDGKVSGLRLRDNAEGRVFERDTDALFVAVGYEPANDLAASLGCELDEAGWVVTGPDQRTSVERVYAAGDLTGGVRQIVTAVGKGSVAALSVFEDLSRQPAPGKE